MMGGAGELVSGWDDGTWGGLGKACPVKLAGKLGEGRR